MKTVEYIEELKYNWNRISKEQEKKLLEHFGDNIGNEYTEQDICEQTRKILENNKKIKLVFM